ncbi:DNA methyltransferase, partial [Campylobacter upsaliensis]|nr:DNA methyltransferase [Campylobacter upsaliensis]EJW3041067.1 DNA methyltransferase [Campylobacter upsaliensis]
VFLRYGSGNKAERDKICIHLNENSLKQTLQDFKDLSVEELKDKYTLKDSRDWSVERAKSDIASNYQFKEKIMKVNYRPFDSRFTLFTAKSKGFWGTPSSLSQHFLSGENLGLCFSKDCQNFFDTIFISGEITDIHYNGSQCYITPLYLYDINGKTSNFTPEFLAYKAKHKILKDKNEEQILAFIYANLYNPKYRSKYLEYLKIGFPKVSFEVSQKEFERFEKLGSELIKLHLMQEIPQDEIDFIFLKESKKPNFKIEKYQEKERFVENKIILNEDLAISPIGAEIWNYTIGGYQVLKQWLKYRKDYVCTKEELEHLLKICKILKKTIEIQGKLSEV